MTKRDTFKAFQSKLRCVSLLLIVLVCPAAGAEDVSPDSILRFASGTSGSGIAQQTRVIASSLWEHSRNHSSHLSTHHFGVAMSSAGSGMNLKNLSEGRVEFAVARADLARAACARPASFGLNVSTDRIRLVTHLAPALIHILVRTDIAGAPGSLPDLHGRSVSIGLPGDMAQHSLKGVFEAHGVTWRSLKLAYYPVNESYRQLVAGQLDAIVIIDQPESPQLAELLQDQQNRLLELDPEVTEAFIQQSAHSDAYRVDSKALHFNGRTLTTMAIDMLLLAEETVGPESITLVLDHIAGSENHKNAWRDSRIEGESTGFRIELHPAAIDTRQTNLHDEHAAATQAHTQLESDPGRDSQ